ncbi:hypothetical protein JJC04_06515 [Flavobacterium covae]|nr:hypothetical protein [Flavobacterium covae]QYS92207.1 hypothetical protein JJC04_06515 [Flavobacterium covae]
MERADKIITERIITVMYAGKIRFALFRKYIFKLGVFTRLLVTKKPLRTKKPLTAKLDLQKQLKKYNDLSFVSSAK